MLEINIKTDKMQINVPWGCASDWAHR